MSWSPAVDIVDKADELVLTAEMPGLSKDDVQPELADPDEPLLFAAEVMR